MEHRTDSPSGHAQATNEPLWKRAAALLLAFFVPALIIGAGFFLSPQPLSANPSFPSESSEGLRVEVQAAYNLVVDSNAQTPSTYAPRVATVAGRFCNDSGATMTNVYGYIGNLLDDDAINSPGTPGIYPKRNSDDSNFVDQHGWAGNTGNYAFTHIGGAAGAADATRFIGDLEPGEENCKVQYWSFTYPACANANEDGDPVEPPCTTTPTWGDSIKPDDDLWLEFDIWATADGIGDNESTAPAYARWRMTMRNQISAMANKIRPNPDGHWFNTDTNVVAPGSVITTNGVLYSLGNVRFGFDNDGDFVPDYNAWLQPFGDPSYDPSCFRLIRSSTVLTVSRSAGNDDLIIKTDDQKIHDIYGGPLYFTNLPSDNTGVRGEVRYTFLALTGPCALPISPYQEVASGFDNEKFNGDFGTGIPSVQSSAAQVTISKSGDPDSVALGAEITYSIPFYNESEDSDAGLTLISGGINMPLVIRDEVPEGLQYKSGSANISFDGYTSSATIRYSRDGGTTWTTDPDEVLGDPLSAAPNTFIIEWWLDDPVPSAGTSPTPKGGTATFQAIVPGNYISEGGDPFIVNEACANFGGATDFACDTDVTMVEGDNSIGDFVWADLNANGVQDGGAETGIEGITVWLYWDVNGNGVLDDDALLIAVTETDADGEYIFPYLPDGNYLVVVDSDSSALPQGYANTTPAVHAVTGLSGATGYDLADFGFGPVLSLIKRVVEDPGPPAVPPAYEGHPVTYEIELTNNLPGGPSDDSGRCVYTVWANILADADGSWNTPESAAQGGPNGNYATINFQGAQGQNLVVQNFSGDTPTGEIIKVEALFNFFNDAQITDFDDRLRFYVRIFNASNNQPQQGTSFDLTINNGLNNFAQNQHTYAWDVTSNLSWILSDFTSTPTRPVALDVERRKGNAGSNTVVNMDAIGFRITTNQLCGGQSSIIDPLPLTDTYDADKLQFVSASIAPSSVITGTDDPYNNTGTISWNNVGPLHAGQTKTVTVTFLGLEPPGNETTTITNTAAVTGATFSNGRPANDVEDDAVIDLEPTGSIGNTIWNDLDGDGIQDTDEPGIPGVTVELYWWDGAAWVLQDTQITDSNGEYLFEGLLDGDYQVRVDNTSLPGMTQTGDPDGTLDNQTDVTITNANDVDTANFGYTIPIIIYGNVWQDFNGNGTKDDDDAPIVDVDVTLYWWDGDDWQAVGTEQTDTDGNYLFDAIEYLDIVPGEYYVATDPSSLPAGPTWINTYDPDGTLNNESGAIVVTAGEMFGSYDFGYHQTGPHSISGNVYADWNSNAEFDSGDAGFGGITVTLYSSTGAVISTTVTNPDGSYTFNNLPDGDYTVAVDETTLPPQYSQTENYGEPGFCDVCGGQGDVTIGGSPVSNVNFGYEPAGYGTIGDRVWRDSNGDGLQQAGEPGLENITVYLYVDLNGDGDYVLVDETVTGANGIYNFENLPPGDYRVEVDTADTDLPTDGYGNPMVTTTPTSFDVTLASGQTYLDADFGFAPGGVIGNTIYWDANANAEQDANELGIEGVTVELWVWDPDEGENGDWVPYDDTVTDENGEYLFTGLPEGEYQVRVDTDSEPIAGHDLTGDPDTNGIPCTPDPGEPWSDFCDSQHAVEITPGQIYMGADFGYQPTGVIGDYIWLDSNGDGVQDPGEGPIPFVTVNLYEWVDDAWEPVAATFTDADGYYSFANLTEGTYRVEVDESTLPDGVQATYDRENGADNPGNVVNDIVVDENGNVTSIGGESCSDCNLEIDFGYAYVGDFAISGYIFDHPVDEDGDPLTDSRDGPRVHGGDLTYPDVTVYLWRQNEGGGYTLIAETVTGSNGYYEFNDLPPGDYAVSVDANDPALEGNSHVTGPVTPNGYGTEAENDGMVFEYVAIDASDIEHIDFGFGGEGNPTAITLQSLLATPSQRQAALPAVTLALMVLLLTAGYVIRRRELTSP